MELGGVGCWGQGVSSLCCANGDCLQERCCSCGDAALETGVRRWSSRMGEVSKGERCETCWFGVSGWFVGFRRRGGGGGWFFIARCIMCKKGVYTNLRVRGLFRGRVRYCRGRDAWTRAVRQPGYSGVYVQVVRVLRARSKILRARGHIDEHVHVGERVGVLTLEFLWLLFAGQSSDDEGLWRGEGGLGARLSPLGLS